jgi:hypothetical protein
MSSMGRQTESEVVEARFRAMANTSTKSKEDEEPNTQEVWPSLFSTREKTHFLEISQDRRTLKYTGKGINSHDVGVSSQLVVFFIKIDCLKFC